MDALSVSAIRQVVEDFLAGRLTSSIMSEPVPGAQNGTVTSIVAANFDEVVMEEDGKDVVVLYYSPTCRHCKAVAPTWAGLGDLLRPYADRITVAQIDATSNDVWPRVSKYPTIKLFRSRAKGEPILYEGNRTVDDFVRFLRDNGSQGIREVLGGLVDGLGSEGVHDEL